jgi:hypothetical protein
MYYELTSGDETYGIVTNNLTAIQPTYNTFQTFVKNNPEQSQVLGVLDPWALQKN